MFDPRSADILATQKTLPAVPSERLLADSIRQRFVLPPSWQPEQLREIDPNAGTLVPAAVLLAIVARPTPTVLLTVRSAHLHVHAGQIAFPGGKIDAQDADSIGAALREAHEEIGLHPSSVDVLGALPAFSTGTGFSVTPVVGLVQQGVPLVPNPGEVDHVFEVPLSFALNPANHLRQQMEFQGRLRKWYAIPYRQDDREFYIWGATAGMLRNFYHFLMA